MEDMDKIFSAAAIEEALRTIAPHVRRTPLLFADGGDFGLPGVRLAFKLEYLQCAGSFKARGAFYNLLSRAGAGSGEWRRRTGGNHGAAVAYAAMRLGLPATIFVPGVASPAKLEQIAPLMAAVFDRSPASAMRTRWRRARPSSRKAAPCRCTPSTRSKTLSWARLRWGWRLERDAPDLDAVLIAVGGGGLDRRGDGVVPRAHTGASSARAGTGAHAGARWKRAGRSMRRPAASPPIRWRRNASGLAEFFDSQGNTGGAKPAGDRRGDLSPRRLSLSWACCAWWWNRAARPRSRQACRRRFSASPPGATVGIVLCGANTTAVKFS